MEYEVVDQFPVPDDDRLIGQQMFAYCPLPEHAGRYSLWGLFDPVEGWGIVPGFTGMVGEDNRTTSWTGSSDPAALDAVIGLQWRPEGGYDTRAG